ncbi:NAD(P)/FAD-dependent oxidoreductase [Chitinimonas lacunae]|uniref:NAD(P)/FAD-dependent oxidoreductase n=1 Tax=Chitinimonas lacunae TaxID=1963018 RepID=A0ABV8MM13_9NEIS
MSAAITIIGTGLAGYTVARELRKLAPEVPLRLITSDDGTFYSKPMLSNAFASGKAPEQLAMKSAPKMAEELRADIRTASRVESIDRAAHVIEVGGERLAYRKLVLALGADPFTPGLSGEGAKDVLHVNDLTDYSLFRAASAGRRRLAILGAGLIGCEFANDLAGAGFEVTLLDPAAWPLSRLLPEVAGRFMRERLEALGVAFRFGTSATEVSPNGQGYLLQLSDGSTLEADLVLSAIGLRPRLGLAQAAGLLVSRGIVVDRFLQTSDPDIYALGDCAEVAGWVLPFVMPIMQAARALGPTLAGQPTALRYPAMPVLVKTPACPTVVAPPAPGMGGQWQVETSTDGVKALFVAEGGTLLGFALLGTATAERQSLAAQLPSWLE